MLPISTSGVKLETSSLAAATSLRLLMSSNVGCSRQSILLAWFCPSGSNRWQAKTRPLKDCCRYARPVMVASTARKPPIRPKAMRSRCCPGCWCRRRVGRNRLARLSRMRTYGVSPHTYHTGAGNRHHSHACLRRSSGTRLAPAVFRPRLAQSLY